MTFVDALLAVLLIVAVAAALTFWNQILGWADRALYPWIKKYLPELEFDVRNAFAALDKVVTPIRNNIKALKNFTEINKAWKMLGRYLLKLLVQFVQKTPINWVQRITYWVIRDLESKEVANVVTEENVNVDSLPPDVREEWVKRGNTSKDVPVTQLREQELRDRKLTLDMTN